MSNFEAPAGIETIFILADLDKNGAGEKAARQLARRLVSSGIDARLVLPDLPTARAVADSRGGLGKGLDWCDVLIAGGCHHA